MLGTVVAALFGMTDFSRIGEGSIFAVPQPFVFGAPVFDIAAILSMFIVIMTETMADKTPSPSPASRRTSGSSR
ncbi:solute carrier family 23 protein [Serinicoccus marinus]|uniref:solute carrier family 23 protein n=1 Tax=Serinicoccus marinus TaxID=247333 RepID=UPI0031EA34B1